MLLAYTECLAPVLPTQGDGPLLLKQESQNPIQILLVVVMNTNCSDIKDDSVLTLS